MAYLTFHYSPTDRHDLTLANVKRTYHTANCTCLCSDQTTAKVRHMILTLRYQLLTHHSNIQTDPLNFGARYNPDPPAVHVTDSGLGDTSLEAPASSQQTSKQNGHGVTEHVRKRSIGDDEDDFEPVKKSRVEGKEMADGDDEAAWAFKRGSKRGLALDEDDEGYESTRGDKRPRNTPKDAISEDQAAESNEMDMDEITDLRPIPRGKKRDRAEAGSTFGGDDDELDDPLDEKPSRRRKRKMLRKRQSDAQPQLRGKKRERDADSASEDEEDMKRSANSRRRKGVEAGDEGEEESEESLNESLASRSSYVKGRKIGEEWEVNGILYKVGPNRQRLRQALVKKARHRFPMVCRMFFDKTVKLTILHSRKILNILIVKLTWRFMLRNGLRRKNLRKPRSVMSWRGRTHPSPPPSQEKTVTLKIHLQFMEKIYSGRHRRQQQ